MTAREAKTNRRVRKTPSQACGRCVVRQGLRERGVAPEVVDAACERLQLSRLRRRQIVFLEGSRAGHFFVIRSGGVKLTRLDSASSERIVGVLGAGDLFGLGAVFGGTYDSTAEVISDTEVCVGASELLGQLGTAAPGFGLSVAAYLYHQLEGAHARLVWLGAVGSRARVAGWLLRQIDEASPAPEIRHALTQTEIGAMLGLCAETVCRALAGLRKAGVIESERQRIVVRDVSRLRAAARL